MFIPPHIRRYRRRHPKGLPGRNIGQFCDPSAIGIFIDRFGRVQQNFVDFSYGAVYWRINIGNSLDGFHITQRVFSGKAIPNCGQVDKDQISQITLCFVTQTNQNRAVIQLFDPFMRFGIQKFLRYVHCKLSFLFMIGFIPSMHVFVLLKRCVI